MSKKEVYPDDITKPDILYRYTNVHLISLSPGLGKTSTATFKLSNGETRWCFYNSTRYDCMLVPAIKADHKLDILIERYLDPKVSEMMVSDKDVTIDWLGDVVRIVGK